MPRRSPHRISTDQAIKELLQLRPIDTLGFLLPDVLLARGQPCSVRFHNVQVRKKDLSRRGLVMDLNIEYGFADGPSLLLVLVEHWSTARSIDLIRTAQYYLDLASRFPGHEIVPIALVTEMGSIPVDGSFVKSALGDEVLRFKTRVVQLSQMQAEDWATARNLVAATTLMAMGGILPRMERLLKVIEFFQQHPDDDETRLLFPLLVQLGKFTSVEHQMTIKYLTKLPKPQFMIELEKMAKRKGRQEGREEGRQEGALNASREDARKMLEHGIPWSVITDVTGLTPEDLR